MTTWDIIDELIKKNKIQIFNFKVLDLKKKDIFF